MSITIVIPAVNESKKIAQDILAADQFLTSSGMKGEIIVVDDGSSDNTAGIAEQTSGKIKSVCIVERLNQNRGKGFAVRTGILKSRGDFVAFTDSGNCVPCDEILVGIDLIRSGQCQIAHGSRKMTGVHILRPQSFYRKICSRLFHSFLIHDIKKLGSLTDTQCGFKVYQGEIARELYAKSNINGFMFDIEIILLALSDNYAICEFPVDWTCDPDSRLKPGHEIIRTLKDVIILKHRFRKILGGNNS